MIWFLFFISSSRAGLNWLERKRDVGKPNIVVMLMDDMGWGDLGINGQIHRETPNIDKLAQSGILFTDFYSANPLCSPSRAAMLTGRLPIRNGFYTDNMKMRNAYTPQDIAGGIKDSEKLMSESLKEAGYATGLVGKWHLGHQEKYLPLNHGFDEWFGAPNCHFGPYDDKKTPNIPVYKNDSMAGRYYEEFEIDRTKSISNYTVELTNEAIDFIRRKASDPFFLYFAPDSSHAPVYSSKAFRGKSRRGAYGDAVMELDWAVGQIISALEGNNLLDDTIVFFSSDNGAACVGGTKEQEGSNGPLLCCKQTTMDGGMRVPGILSWKGKVKPNISYDVAGLMDIYPTMLDLINIKPQVVLDGSSLAPIMKGGTRDDYSHFFYRGDTLAAVRHGAYKMHVYTWSGPAKYHTHFCRGDCVANLTTIEQTDHSG